MKKLPIFLCLLSLAACDTAENSAHRVGGGIKENYDTTRRHIAKWIYDEDYYKAPETPPADQRYCYQVQMDLMCFAYPEPTLRRQMVGYQGEHPDAVMVSAAPAAVNAAGTYSNTVSAPAGFTASDLPPPPGATAAPAGAPTPLMRGF